MKEIGRIIDKLTFPLNVAAGIEARGLNPGIPKAVVSKSSAAIYRQIVQELRQRMIEWGLELSNQ